MERICGLRDWISLKPRAVDGNLSQNLHMSFRWSDGPCLLSIDHKYKEKLERNSSAISQEEAPYHVRTSIPILANPDMMWIRGWAHGILCRGQISQDAWRYVPCHSMEDVTEQNAKCPLRLNYCDLHLKSERLPVSRKTVKSR